MFLCHPSGPEYALRTVCTSFFSIPNRLHGFELENREACRKSAINNDVSLIFGPFVRKKSYVQNVRTNIGYVLRSIILKKKIIKKHILAYNRGQSSTGFRKITRVGCNQLNQYLLGIHMCDICFDHFLLLSLSINFIVDFMHFVSTDNSRLVLA